MMIGQSPSLRVSAIVCVELSSMLSVSSSHWLVPCVKTLSSILCQVTEETLGSTGALRLPICACMWCRGTRPLCSKRMVKLELVLVMQCNWQQCLAKSTNLPNNWCYVTNVFIAVKVALYIIASHIWTGLVLCCTTPVFLVEDPGMSWLLTRETWTLSQLHQVIAFKVEVGVMKKNGAPWSCSLDPWGPCQKSRQPDGLPMTGR